MGTIGEMGGARLAVLAQQRQQRLFIDHAPVGALALERDQPRQRLPRRWLRQACMHIVQAYQDSDCQGLLPNQ